MRKNILKKYNHLIENTDSFNIISVVDRKTLKIILRSEESKKEVLIEFERPIAYRSIDSGFLDKIWGWFDEDMLGDFIYEYENSTFVDYIKEMSLGIYDDWEIRHFAIYGGEVAVDVLSVKEPKVSVQ